MRASVSGPVRVPRQPMAPAQRRTFDELLVVGGDRPTARAGLVDDLRAALEQATRDAVAAWNQPGLWMTKAGVANALRCSGLVVAQAEAPPAPMPLRAAIGVVAHRAIQIAHTHPGHTIDRYVRAAVRASVCDDDAFGAVWAAADAGTQSDLVMNATSMTVNFLDSWPTLLPDWAPRFEEPIQARVGRLTLSCRADLVLGRPRADNRQTMFLADLKTGGLADHHADEAAFYALVATLRHGVPPWRSTVYSLALGEWTDPDVTEEVLWGAVARVGQAVRTTVEVLTETRSPQLEPGPHCRWCPAAGTCPAVAPGAGGFGGRVSERAVRTASELFTVIASVDDVVSNTDDPYAID